MLKIICRQIYEIDHQWVLILYSISNNHYVGLPVYRNAKNNSIFIKSINKYITISEISDYSYSKIKRCIYYNGKPLKITENEFNNLLNYSKNYFLYYVKNNTNNDVDGMSYTKWCMDKLQLMIDNKSIINLRIGAIYWVYFGYNIGNELRKLRPAILWRCSSNRKMWTVIPLTSKHKNDKYYFHCDLENQNLGSARIENMINISCNRIKEPYFFNNKIATISKKDNDSILEAIKKYYVFENPSIHINIENQNKVLT